MRRKIWLLANVMILLTALVAGLIAGGTASAITNGQLDGETHPYVGAVVIDGGAGFASGVLISPRIFLTAGHVTEIAETAETVVVAFDSVCGPYTKFIEAADIYTHPDYISPGKPGTKNFTMYDVGIIILSEDVILPEYGELPDLGLVDTLGVQTDVQLVGYGLERHTGGGPPHWTLDFARRYAPAKLLGSTDINIKVSANIGQDKGFACPGDSGGPVLLGDTNTILALISFSTNLNRMGVSYSSRVDNPEVLEWIEDLTD